MTDEERFWSKVEKSDDGCWEWMGARSNGYGRFSLKRRVTEAHRVSYFLAYGELPRGLFICHSCDNRACVRPDHLRAGTHSFNMKETVQRGRHRWSAPGRAAPIPVSEKWLASRPKWLHRTDKERFWDNVNKTENCWEWTGCTSRGYGVIRFRSRNMRAHRVAYLLCCGPLTPGLFVCHTCDNRNCVRPDHLFLGSHEDNMGDMDAKGRRPRGEAHGNAVLTAPLVTEIRRRVLAGETPTQVARSMDVSRHNVYAIVYRKVWKHLP